MNYNILKKILKLVIIAFFYAILSYWIGKYIVDKFKCDDYNFLIKIFLLIPIIVFTGINILKNKHLFNFNLFNKNIIFSYTLIILIISISIFKKTQLFEIEKNNLPYFLILSFFIQCLMTGIFEEFFCRVLIYGLLLKYFENNNRKNSISILITSFIFSMMHFSGIFKSEIDFISVINQVLFAFIVGIILNSLFHISKNLPLIITIHAMINFNGMFRAKILERNISEKLSESTINDFTQSLVTFFILGLFLALPIFLIATTKKNNYIINESK